MHRSIAGLADAFQSISDGKSVLKVKDEGLATNHFRDELEVVQREVEKNRRLNEAAQYYSEIENSTARIMAKLREVDSVDLNLHSLREDEDSDPVSNQKRFIDDQCYRAQALLTGEYYLRNLHIAEVNKEVADLDERINYTAKNWKHTLVEMGINETELTDLQAPEIEAALEFTPAVSDSRKVRRNSVITQPRPSQVAVESDYTEYNTAEFSELNEILSQFMDQTFLNGQNGFQISRKYIHALFLCGFALLSKYTCS
jgi:hypothetical protein